MAGISNIRNPILVSYIAKGLLPYHGLGSGTKGALDAWPRIDFVDDRDGCQFIACKPETGRGIDLGNWFADNVGKTSGMILDACRKNSTITIPEIAALVGVTERSIERNIQKLQANGLLLRVGGRKEGHWEVAGGVEKASA